MPSETDCLNDALGQIGAARITAIDDGSINANHCQVFYPSLRDGLLRAHHWNFAMQRMNLAADVTPPVSEYAYAYTLPGDCLKVVDYGGGTPSSPVTWVTDYAHWRFIPRYKIEGRKLLTNDGVVSIRYLKQVTSVGEWDAMFYQAVATLLATKLATAILHDHKMAVGLQQIGDHLLSQAMAVDGQEGSIEPFVVDDLLWGR